MNEEKDFERMKEIRNRKYSYSANRDVGFLLNFIEIVTEEKRAAYEFVNTLRQKDDQELKALNNDLQSMRSRLRRVTVDLEFQEQVFKTRMGWLQKKVVKQRDELARLTEERDSLKQALRELGNLRNKIE